MALEFTAKMVGERMSAAAEGEREIVVAYIRERGASAVRIGQKGHQLTAADAARLDRWLGALADDIEAGLHHDD
jgi:hypothetical protein